MDKKLEDKLDTFEQLLRELRAAWQNHETTEHAPQLHIDGQPVNIHPDSLYYETPRHVHTLTKDQNGTHRILGSCGFFLKFTSPEELTICDGKSHDITINPITGVRMTIRLPIKKTAGIYYAVMVTPEEYVIPTWNV